MKKMMAAMILLFVLAAAGCAMDDTEETGAEFSPEMTGTVYTDGKEYDLVQGDYRWERKRGLQTETVRTDHASPYDMAKGINAVSVSPKQILNIRIENDPDLSVYSWTENGRGEAVKQKSGVITAPGEAGRYIYEVEAEWPSGNVSYTFVIEVT